MLDESAICNHCNGKLEHQGLTKLYISDIFLFLETSFLYTFLLTQKYKKRILKANNSGNGNNYILELLVKKDKWKVDGCRYYIKLIF